MKKLLWFLLIMLLLFVLSGCGRRDGGRAVSADDVMISYDVQGVGGPALVFVHGWCCDKSYWKFQVPYFAKQYKVVTVDLAGHGESGSGREDYTIEAFGGDVVAVVEKLGLDEVVLIGHSMGGPVIVEAARRMGGRVIGIVGADTLHDIGKGYSKAEAEKMIFQLELDFAGTMQGFVRSAFKADAEPEVVEWVVDKMPSVNAEAGIGAMEHMGEYDLKEAVKDVRVPIVCINSDFRPVNVEANRKYAQNYEVKMMPGIGHFVMMEDAEEFNRLLAETITEFRKGNCMLTFIKEPAVVKAAGNKPKVIEEFIGRVNSQTEDVSIARMRSPGGWEEAGQRPEFDEYTVVLRGVLRVKTEGETIDVKAGEAVIAHRGEWVQYSTPEPEGAEYIAVCVPAFSIDAVHRDE